MRYKYVIVRDVRDAAKVLLSKVSAVGSDYVSRVALQPEDAIPPRVPAIALNNMRIRKLERHPDGSVSFEASDMQPTDVSCLDALLNAVLLAVMQDRQRLFKAGRAPLTAAALKHYFAHPLRYCERTGRFCLTVQNAMYLRNNTPHEPDYVAGRTHDAVLLLHALRFGSERIAVVWKVAALCPHNDGGIQFIIDDENDLANSLPDDTDINVCYLRMRHKLEEAFAELNEINERGLLLNADKYGNRNPSLISDLCVLCDEADRLKEQLRTMTASLCQT
jgi:hypothetical protein